MKRRRTRVRARELDDRLVFSRSRTLTFTTLFARHIRCDDGGGGHSRRRRRRGSNGARFAFALVSVVCASERVVSSRSHFCLHLVRVRLLAHVANGRLMNMTIRRARTLHDRRRAFHTRRVARSRARARSSMLHTHGEQRARARAWHVATRLHESLRETISTRKRERKHEQQRISIERRRETAAYDCRRTTTRV